MRSNGWKVWGEYPATEAARNADLVRVLADIAIPPMACWLVVHRELRGTPRLRAVADALAAALGPAA